VWNGLRIMQCVDAPDSSHPWDSRPWIWVLVSLGVVALLALIGWLFFRFYGQPHIVHKLIGLRKKIKGPPVFGKATVVVTDIQGFSEMMHREPMLMVSALVKHNRIIAQVKSQNFGYTIEQEGDSFSILFEEAVDALRFCVQAQAALDAEPWPQALFVKPSLVRDEDGPGRATTGSEVKSPSSFLAKLRSLTQLPSIKSNFTKPSQALSLSLAEESAWPSPGASSGQALSSQVAISMAPAPSCPPSSPYMTSSKQGQGEAVKGLRVRMGVASGIISKGVQGIAGSALLSDAKTVSDAAAGGQILVDYTTFHLIKDRLVDLVSPDGIQMEPSGAALHRGPAALCCKGMDTKGSATEALLLDMGTYFFHGTSRHPAALSMMLTGRDIQPTVAVDRSEDRSIAPVQRSLPQSTTQATGVSPPPNVIRLFQILSPLMIHRLQYFPSKPTLKEGWDCIDAPLTEAVGALMALTPGSNRPLLPSVTMVFSQVESSSNYLARHRLDASKVHLEIAAIMKSILRQIPGGYCVREQEAELKYLTAFSTPESALLFCISFQECLHLYALSGRLPQSATSFWGKEEDCFCGPRVKMGVFEGRPSSISPDHNGKADYHGHCINMAARLMDAAAHGGMVACPADLAERVFRSWSSRYDEDPDAAGAEPIPAWEPKRDSLVDGRLLEVSTKPVGVFQMKGSEELLSLVNVSPLALAGRQLPSSAPKGKGNRVSMNDGPLLRSALPLLKLTDEYARLPKLPSEVASQSTVSPPHLSTMGMLRATYSRIRSLGRDYASTAGISSGFTRQPSRRSEITEREDSCHYHDSHQSHGQSEGRHAGGQDKTHYSLSDANRTMSC
jgi:class 3 adenylate cyclase